MLCAVDSMQFYNNLIVNRTFSYEEVREEYIRDVISFVFHNVISFVLSLLKNAFGFWCLTCLLQWGLSVAWHLAASCSINTAAGTGSGTRFYGFSFAECNYPTLCMIKFVSPCNTVLVTNIQESLQEGREERK